MSLTPYTSERADAARLSGGELGKCFQCLRAVLFIYINVGRAVIVVFVGLKWPQQVGGEVGLCSGALIPLIPPCTQSHELGLEHTLA